MTEKPKFRIAVMGHSFMHETPATPSQWAMERAREAMGGYFRDPAMEEMVVDVALAIDAAVAEEREACASVADFAFADAANYVGDAQWAGGMIARQIRARGAANDEEDGA